MKELKLADIIKNIDAKSDYDGELVITGVSTDTRTIQPGDLFIALVGEKFNGHSYVSVAEEKGAAAVICSEEVETSLPVLMVENTLLALHRLAAFYRGLLNIKVVAVTGSNGKTTTRDMIKTVLSSKYKVFSTEKNYNNEIGLPKSILQIDDSYDIAVLEMGMNHPGEIRRLTNIARPDVAVITNIGKAHIGNLGSQENILKAKLEILEGLDKNGLIIFNGDDSLLKAAHTGDFKKVFVGIDSDNLDLSANDITMHSGKTKFTVKYNGRKVRGCIPVLGKYNVLNSLEAVFCGMHFGIDAQDALSALSEYKSVSMRCETETVKGVTIVKDYYNSSPDSVRVALETLGSYTKSGKKIALLGEMLELGDFSEKEHRRLGEACVQNQISYAFFIGSDYEAFSKGMPNHSRSFKSENRNELLKAVKDFVDRGKISEGDVVLIKGSRGMKMEEIYEALVSYLGNG